MNENLTVLQKCLVDVDGFFTVGKVKFKIDENNKDYKVKNSYKTTDNYTNDAKMMYVYACLNVYTWKLIVLNEHFEEIHDVKVVDGK